jgi:predicted AlkP superfamily pyrophosphatase or phosphodiesterase
MIILFSIDGMRPDGLIQADTPTIDSLIGAGASTMTARTVMPSVTLPCHTSMLRGVDVPRHGITSNVFQPLARPVPSLFDAAKAAGKRTGFFYNWGQLRDLFEPDSLDVGYVWNNAHSADGDWRIARAAAVHLQERAFDFLFVYLGWTDECGHAHGWMTPEYLDAIANADRCIAHVLEACREVKIAPTVLVQSDHGGHGRSHGTDCAEDMTIPWILSGAGIRPGVTLETPVRIFDTCPTLAALLGVPADRAWDGKIISEAFVNP